MTDDNLRVGRAYCQGKGCPDLVKAPLPPGQKGTQKVLCQQTGFMPDHMKVCPNDEKYGKNWTVSRSCPF
jgi:hypothetical protein